LDFEPRCFCFFEEIPEESFDLGFDFDLLLAPAPGLAGLVFPAFFFLDDLPFLAATGGTKKRIDCS